MIAEAMAGNGDGALDYYLRINPSAREAISEIHRCEPYVYAQMIAGRDAPTHGEAKNSWLTGTAAWNFVAISQWILASGPSTTGCASPRASRATGRVSAPRRGSADDYEINVRGTRPWRASAVAVVDGTPDRRARAIPLPPPEATRPVEVRLP